MDTLIYALVAFALGTLFGWTLRGVIWLWAELSMAHVHAVDEDEDDWLGDDEPVTSEVR